jgi:hypothetical protein
MGGLREGRVMTMRHARLALAVGAFVAAAGSLTLLALLSRQHAWLMMAAFVILGAWGARGVAEMNFRASLYEDLLTKHGIEHRK